jgi:hypothetical protein
MVPKGVSSEMPRREANRKILHCSLYDICIDFSRLPIQIDGEVEIWMW